MQLAAFIPDYFQLWHLPVVFFAGLVGESYATVIGSGGVLIQFVLAWLGMPLTNVIATDLAGCVGADVGIVVAAISPRVMWDKRKLLLLLTVPLFLGGVTGTFFLMHIQVVFLKYILIVGLSLLLLQVLLGKRSALQTLEELHLDVRRYPVVFVVLFILGVYANVSGVGSGTFMKLVFISMLRISMAESMGMGSIISMPASIFSFIATALAGLIVWPYCFALWVGTYIGGRYTAGYARRVPDRYLRRLLLTAVSVYLVWLLNTLWH